MHFSFSHVGYCSGFVVATKSKRKKRVSCDLFRLIAGCSFLFLFIRIAPLFFVLLDSAAGGTKMVFMRG